MNASRRHSLIVAFAFVFFVASALSQSASSGLEPSSMHDQISSSGHQVVERVDIKPHQKNVLAVELALAEGIIQKLNQPQNVFSGITFGVQTPNLLRQSVAADEAIASRVNS